MSISLVGIVIVQFLWIMNAVKINEEQFGRKVTESLNEVVDRIEMDETCKILTKNLTKIDLGTKSNNDSLTKYIKQSQHSHAKVSKKKKNKDLFSEDDLNDMILKVNKLTETFNKNTHDSLMRINDSLLENNIEIALSHQLNDLINLSFDLKRNIPFDSLEKQTEIEKKVNDKLIAAENKIKIKLGKMDAEFKKKGIVIKNLPDYPDAVDIPDTMNCDKICITVSKDQDKISVKTDKFRDVVEKLVVEYESKDIPLSQRLDQLNVSGLLETVFEDNAIDLPFEYIVKHKNDTAIISTGFSDLKGKVFYMKNLFPNDLVDKSAYLMLYFPDRSSYIYKSISFMIVGSVGFTLIMLLTFIVTIFAMIRQKKNSEIKNDFINNMTHEFKTPIATISLASDAINNPAILENKEQILKFNGIIKEESIRMNSQVEKVLQMSLFDKKDIDFNFTVFNIHEQLEKAVDRIRLQLEQKEGQIIIDLTATEYYVKADAVHLSGALLNLLDNAIKYSKENPEIKILTFNKENVICISISDNGIGMEKDDAKRVFERFFRVHTGNVHNVKGFGLGLCYVKEVINAFKGKITVQSVKGSGSTFTICLPTIQNEQ